MLIAKFGILRGMRMVAEYLVRRTEVGNGATSSKEKITDGFDEKYGVNTAGAIRLSHLDIQSENWVYGTAYQPVALPDMAELWDGLDLRCEDFVFIDIGSGKGRAVLQAACFPFKRVIGVEFSPALHEIAQQNALRFPVSARKCHQIEFVCEDAASYVLPDEPLLLFLFNPFAKPTMQRFAESLSRSFLRRPRRIIVCYVVPQCSEVWGDVPFLRRVKSAERLHVYDTRSEALAPALGAMR